MKTKLFIALGIAISTVSNAQVRDVYSTRSLSLPQEAVVEENTIQNVFRNLDKSKIQTGLLLDAAIEFADLKKYNGTPTDSSYTNAKIVGDIYNTIVMSKISSNRGTMKPPADFHNEWFNSQSIDILPVAGVYYKYNKFSESNNDQFLIKSKSSENRTANVSTRTLTITSDKTVKDLYVNGVWQNPYEIEKVFAMAPIANSHNKLKFKVTFPEELFQSNYANEISKLEVKFSDNENFKTVNAEQPMLVSYPAIGEYTWTYKLTLTNGQILYSKNKFSITDDLGKYVLDENNDTTSRTMYRYKRIQLENFQYFIPFPPMVVNRPKLTLYIKYRTGQNKIK
ncbi:hypothetical protein [Riemerella columbipharyngis]|uniref:Uncharacterized protein n=1 Tax=Riemerella columbipharyngis TaxID=1071918 RepID=A0A1G7ERP2_9FLAO|nr:hypothetical protein [Riemerella columbipharyngis]SDE66322.1 hypothetical protein SAMN05421544_11714 [Riemerella columbipharyngis]